MQAHLLICGHADDGINIVYLQCLIFIFLPSDSIKKQKDIYVIGQRAGLKGPKVVGLCCM